MKRTLNTILILFFMLSFTGVLAASSDTILKVATKSAPPFAMKSPTGEWEGVSIELWQEIAKRLNLKYEFQEETLSSMLDKMRNRELDVAVAAITVTSEREKFVDFTQSYYTSNLAIAIPQVERSMIKIILDNLLSLSSLWVAISVVLTLFVAAFAFWFMERKSLEVTQKITFSDSLWWAVVTMTTVGYGDKTPSSSGGKFVAVVWMFVSMFLVAMLIATSASILTVNKLGYFISSPNDLTKGDIASVDDSFSANYLKDRHIYATNYKTINKALQSLNRGKVDAFVYDEPILRYLIDRKYNRSLKLTESKFKQQNYSIMLKEGSNLREDIDRTLLEIIESPKWKDIKSKYLGTSY